MTGQDLMRLIVWCVTTGHGVRGQGDSSRISVSILMYFALSFPEMTPGFVHESEYIEKVQEVFS